MSLHVIKSRFRKLLYTVRTPSFLKAFLFHRVLPAVEHRAALDYDLATVVDVGANRGQFTLAARQWAPDARVIAFEPLDAPAQTFGKVFASDSSVRLHQVALGGREGNGTIYVMADDDASSLLPASEKRQEIFPGGGPVREEQVTVVRVEHVLSSTEIVPPALLKLDVQGYELEVLRGFGELLDQFEAVVTEVSLIELYERQPLASEVICFLVEQGFILSNLYNVKSRHGRAIQADLLFKRDEPAAHGDRPE